MEQHNPLRESIEQGDTVIGARSTMFSPTVIEIYGELGLDFVWLDFEHAGPSPYDSTLFEDLTRAAEVGGTELFVRLPSGDPPLIRKVLDAGVRNILIPRVDSASEVREAVKATRFLYDGKPGERGKASGRASNWDHAEEYIQTEDEQICLGVMIEKTTAVDDLDAILSVPELGFIFIGQSDLSVQMGHPNDRNHPSVHRQMESVCGRSLEAGIPVGCVAHDPKAAQDAVDDGYQILRIGGELEAAQETLKRRLDQL